MGFLNNLSILWLVLLASVITVVFILLILAEFFYVPRYFDRDCNKKIKQGYFIFLSLTFLLLLFCTFLLTIIYAIYRQFGMNSDVSMGLTTGTLTVVAIIISIFGIIFSSKQNRIQKLHSESG